MVRSEPSQPDRSKERSFLRRVFGRKGTKHPEDVVVRIARRDVEEPVGAPLVVVACEKCGFDYHVSRIRFDDGTAGAIWSCACGSRYIPPGGGESFSLVRR